MTRHLAALLLLATACSRAASTAYVGDLNPPADASPVIFAPGIISTGDVFASTFMPDGKTVVFTKAAAGKPLTLMQSQYSEHSWTPPATMPFSGTYRDLDPAFTPDGRRLYFSSRRPTGPSPADTASLDDTWYVDRTGDGWSVPRRVPGAVNSNAIDMYPSAARNGNLYFDSHRSQRRMAYTAPALPGGGWGEPVLLDVSINGDSGASNLFVDPDERFVVFAAQRPGGRGAADLYISMRTPTGGWGPAKSLGDGINTSSTEFCPFVSHDGRYLFFTRATPRDGQPPLRNIYVARFDVLLARLGSG